MPSDGRDLNQTETAMLFGVTPATIRTWERRGCPVVKQGRKGVEAVYNTAAVIRWREEQAALAASGDLSSMDVEEARRRKLAAEAALAELDLAVRRGDFVEIEQVGKAVEEEYATIRANLTSLPGEVAADLEGLTTAERQELIAAKVSEILTALAADDEYRKDAV